MRGIGRASCFFSAGLFLAAVFAASGQKDDPSPLEKEQSQSAFPKQCAGFLRTERTRLASVWGNYEQIATILATAFSADRRYALVATVPFDPENDPGTDGDSDGVDSLVTLWDTSANKAVRS